MLKSLLTGACAVVVALFPIASASAADTPDPLAKWVARVNKQINKRMQEPFDDACGVARVSFRRGADGRAFDIQAQSGHRSLASAGRRTLKLLRNLPPLPAGMPANQRIVMDVLIDGHDLTVPFEVQRARLLAAGAASNAKLAASLGGAQVASLDR